MVLPARPVELLLKAHPYHDNNGMIIQVIFFELIQAFEKLGSIEQSLAHMNQTAESSLVKRNLLHTITTDVSSLAGHSQKTMRIFASYLTEGILAKVMTHCSLLANNHDPEDRSMGLLKRHAVRSWTQSMQILDLLRELEQTSSQITSDISSLLRALLEKMVNLLKRLAKMIAKIAVKFHENENVVYFLLMYKDRLDAIYKKGFVSQLFNKMFPEGIRKAEEFLSVKYLSRGFDQLIPLITQKFAELECKRVSAK